MANQLLALEQAQSTVIDLVIKFGPKVVVAALVLTAGFYAGRWIGTVIDRWLGKLELDIPVRVLLVRISRLVVLAFFLIVALQNLGVDLIPLIAGLGVAGAGVALAMQGVLGNLAAGLTIIFTRPFRVGEYVAIVGVEGEVTAIDLFSTKLSHPDHSMVIVPNRKIVGEILHNYGRIRQLELHVSIIHVDELDPTLKAIEAALNGSPIVLPDPKALFGVTTLTDSSIVIAVKPWVKVTDYPVAGAEINRSIVEEIRAAGVDYPPATRDIRIVRTSAA
ncbi:MAG TPA: mechanosensitive ion channel family protein [Rhodocyclaceae bacterium]|nr:mechanosensitive ion channel family protein [Rhodocyclaceae bacterium]